MDPAEIIRVTVFRRLPVRFTTAVVEQEPGDRQGLDAARYRSLFFSGVSADDAYRKVGDQRFVRMMVAPH